MEQFNNNNNKNAGFSRRDSSHTRDLDETDGKIIFP